MNADEFNARFPVGIPVLAYPGARPEDFPNDRRLVTRTRSKATVLGGHTDVVWVDGHSACIALSHVDVVTEDEWKVAKQAEAMAAQGALPVPVGDQTQALSEVERLRRERDYLDVRVRGQERTIRRLQSERVSLNTPALLAEVQRLKAELADQRAYEKRLREQHDLDVKQIRRLRDRVAELERPAIEAKRNEERQSFTDLIAAAEKDRDFEGAFDVQCRLREREEQWEREDEEAAR